MLVDAHCHFDYPCFDGARDRILRECKAAGVGRLVIPGVQSSTWSRVKAIADSDDSLSYCLGIHPWFIDRHSEADLARLHEQLAGRASGCVALGECGLDRLHGDLKAQMPWFEAQVDIALSLDVPLVIHSVRTHDEVLSVLRRKRFSGKVLLHGFSGSPEQAMALAEQGCFIGVGGVITYARAHKTRRAIAALPIESLVLETDAPDMPPEDVKKGENSPSYLSRVFQSLCDMRPEPEEVIGEQLLANVNSLYRWGVTGRTEGI